MKERKQKKSFKKMIFGMKLSESSDSNWKFYQDEVWKFINIRAKRTGSISKV